MQITMTMISERQRARFYAGRGGHCMSRFKMLRTWSKIEIEKILLWV